MTSATVARKLAPRLLARFSRLPDATSVVADVLDDLGFRGVIGASVLSPLLPGSTVAGSALTVRNLPRQEGEAMSRASGEPRLRPFRAHELAGPGDFLLIESRPGTSNLGRVSALMGKRRGEVGAIVDGGVRDVASIRRLRFPVWAREITPASGRWRSEGVEVNVPIVLAGVQVRPGDLVVADDTGVCIVPRRAIEDVIVRCEAIVADEVAADDELNGAGQSHGGPTGG